MKKLIRTLVAVSLVLLPTAAFAKWEGPCVPGAVFRGRDGVPIDSLESLGSDCAVCTVIVQEP